MIPQARPSVNIPTSVVYSLLCFQNQMKLFHWQTTSYAQHNAFGFAYDELNGLIDTFVEVMMGSMGRPAAPAPMQLIPIASDADGRSTVMGFEQFLLGLDNAVDCETNPELLNIRDEMLGVTRKLRYLLTLK